MALSDREQQIFASITREFGDAERVQTRRAAVAAGALLVLGIAPVAWTLTIAPWAATLSLLVVLASSYVAAREVLQGRLWSRPQRSPRRTRRSADRRR